jgi:hypothetical protein
MVEEERRTDDGSSDQAMQHEGAGKVDAELVAVAIVVTAELEISGYDCSLRL